jgi:hypothetical protein
LNTPVVATEGLRVFFSRRGLAAREAAPIDAVDGDIDPKVVAATG